jgi:hypothetical protein
VQGNCSTAPSGEQSGLPAQSKVEWKPGQCALIVGRAVLKALSTSLWLDNIYVHVVKTPGITTAPTLQVADHSKLWMTNVTFQGYGGSAEECPVCGFTVDEHSKVFADGVF